MKYAKYWLLTGVIAPFMAINAAEAQLTIPVLQSDIPFNYSRGRNVGVADRDRPEYQAIGIDAGAFTIYPRVDAGAGFTDNVFETNLVKKSSAYISIVPVVKIASNWSRNSLNVEAGADLREFTAYSVRDQNAWHITANSKLEIGADTSISVLGSSALQYETRFSGSSPADLASATPYQLTQAQLVGVQEAGRFRFTLQGGFVNAAFDEITLLTGERMKQAYRNRDVYTVSGQGEYALTPDVSAFAQVQYQDTRYYSANATGLNDLSSKQVRAIGGLSFDITAKVRGSIGVGYSERRYDSPLYDNVGGLTVESKIEYFPSELTTFTIEGRRAIEDSDLVGSPGFFNSGFGVQVDHEFLRNLLANVGLDYERDDYRGIDSQARIFSVNGGAHYLFSRSLGLAATVSYGQRHSSGVFNGPVFSETSGLLSIFLQR